MKNNKRLAIFAHFDKQSIIDQYVINYLLELRKYSEIIFVSDGILSDEEQAKIKDLCFTIISKRHGEYDFGSYKIGFQLLQEEYPNKLAEIDELLFVNDSCYLVGSLEKIFANMEQKQDCDFWGLTDEYTSFDNPRYHLQSYFLVFRKTVFTSNLFQNFISQITKQESKDEIIYKYEIGLSEFLIKNNKKPFAYFGVDKVGYFLVDNHIDIADKISVILEKNSNISLRYLLLMTNNIFNVHTLNYSHSNKFYLLLKMDFPLIKRKILDAKEHFLFDEKLTFFWRGIVEKFYPNSTKQIEEHCNRIGVVLKKQKIIKNRFNLFLSSLIATKLFYIKKYTKNGKNVTTIKFLFFKIKYGGFTRFKIFGLRILKITNEEAK